MAMVAVGSRCTAGCKYKLPGLSKAQTARGVAAGVIGTAAMDLLWCALVGVYEPIWRYDGLMLERDLSAHLVYSVATASASGALGCAQRGLLKKSAHDRSGRPAPLKHGPAGYARRMTGPLSEKEAGLLRGVGSSGATFMAPTAPRSPSAEGLAAAASA
jgi:hypothetical protein